MKVPVNITSDITMGASLHGYWNIAEPGPPPEKGCPPAPAVEMPVNQGWPVGVGMGSVRKAATVKHKGQEIICDASDCGLLIPHMTDPSNVWLPILPLTSSRKVAFAAGTVHMNGTPAAVASPAFFPMVSCGTPASLPLSFPVTNLGNTVNVGVTLADIVGGALTIAATIAIDRLFKNHAEPGDNALAHVFADSFGRVAAKTGLSALAGFATSGLQHAVDSRYPFKLSFDVAHRIGNFRVSGQFGSSDTRANASQVTIGGSVGVVPLRGGNANNGSVRADGSATLSLDGPNAGAVSERGSVGGGGRSAGRSGSSQGGH